MKFLLFVIVILQACHRQSADYCGFEAKNHPHLLGDYKFTETEECPPNGSAKRRFIFENATIEALYLTNGRVGDTLERIALISRCKIHGSLAEAVSDADTSWWMKQVPARIKSQLQEPKLVFGR